MVESKAYAIARSGTGCGAGVFGAGDTVFLLIDIISEDPTDIMSYVFSVLYLYAWWQQNGKMITKVDVSKIQVDLWKMYSGFFHQKRD